MALLINFLKIRSSFLLLETLKTQKIKNVHHTTIFKKFYTNNSNPENISSVDLLQVKKNETETMPEKNKNEVEKWLETRGLEKLFPIFKKEKFDSIENLILIKNSDLIAMGVEEKERESILVGLAKFDPNENIIDRIKFIFTERPDSALPKEEILKSILLHTKTILKKTKIKVKKTKKKSKSIRFQTQWVFIGMIPFAILYFGLSSKNKNYVRNNLVDQFACDREEIKKLTVKLNFNTRDLEEIEKICRDTPGEMDVDNFLEIVYTVYEKQREDHGVYKKWELLCLYRNSPYKIKNGKIYIPLQELLSALSILAVGDPSDKLDFIFKLHSRNISGNNLVDFEGITNIFAKMTRFRHFYADSIIYKTKYFPIPIFSIYSQDAMAELFFNEINNNKTEQVNKKQLVDLEEFKQICSKISKKKRFYEKKFEIWYLDV